MNNKIDKKNAFNFNEKKENTICSLYEVENFLCALQKTLKCFKLYSIFK